MELAISVVVVVMIATVFMGLVGYLVDRGTEKHVSRGDRQ
jgi:preprotein translocase subunit SecE